MRISESLDRVDHEFQPLGFRLFGDDARGDEDSLPILQEFAIQPLLGIVFVRLASEDLVSHHTEWVDSREAASSRHLLRFSDGIVHGSGILTKENLCNRMTINPDVRYPRKRKPILLPHKLCPSIGRNESGSSSSENTNTRLPSSMSSFARTDMTGRRSSTRGTSSDPWGTMRKRSGYCRD